MRAKIVMTLSSVLITLLLMIGGSALAQTSTFEILWYTVDSGGGEISNSESGYTLLGTVGQPDTGRLTTTTGYQLNGGWHVAGQATDLTYVYLPIILKNQ